MPRVSPRRLPRAAREAADAAVACRSRDFAPGRRH